MEIGMGLGGYLPTLRPSLNNTPAPASGASAASAAGASRQGQAANATPAADAVFGAAGAEGGANSESIAQEKAFAKVMQDRFNQECQTCKNRRYQDGSNDPGVSFQTPQHIDPSVSASAVMSHEQEHVTRNKAAAEAEGGEVIQSTVVLHGDICPECGRYYIAGGTTYTTTRSGGESHAHQQEPGSNMDLNA